MPCFRLSTILLVAFWMLCAALGTVAFWTQVRLGSVWISAEVEPTLLGLARLQAAPWIAAALLTPFAVRWSSRAVFTRDRWRGPAAAHAAGVVLYAAAFTLLSLAIGLALRGHLPFWPGTSALVGRLAGNLALAVTTYAVIAGASSAFHYQREAHDRAIQADRHARARAELERDLASARLLVLRQQLQPHFLFNALNAVSGLIEDDPAAARRVLARLGDLLRLALDRHEAAYATLGEELDFVDRYLAVEQARLGERLRVNYDVPGILLGTRLPAFALQPLVENAVRHGLARLSEGGAIEISARGTAGTVEVLIANDAPAALPRSTEGVGLGGLRARLRGLYGDRARIEARVDANGRFTVVLRVPAGSA